MGNAFRYMPFISIVVIAPCACAAQENVKVKPDLPVLTGAMYEKEKSDKVDALFEKWDTKHTPGAALAIVAEGDIIYKKSYGMADLEHGIPITT